LYNTTRIFRIAASLLVVLSVFAANAATRQAAIFGEYNPVTQLVALLSEPEVAEACGSCCGSVMRAAAKAPLELPGCA